MKITVNKCIFQNQKESCNYLTNFMKVCILFFSPQKTTVHTNKNIQTSQSEVNLKQTIHRCQYKFLPTNRVDTRLFLSAYLKSGFLS